jgi:hypothetical protein
MISLAEEPITAPKPYEGFEKQYIGGAWRSGRAAHAVRDANPYTGEILLEIASANEADLDDAYRSAAGAQSDWADQPPAARAQVMLGVAAAMKARRAEIVSWLVRESGSTRLKAEMEWESTHAIVLEGSPFLTILRDAFSPATFSIRSAGCIASRSAWWA